MATQFTGTDKANLLSTALEADTGDNIAITATSDATVLGLGEKDTIVLGVDVTNVSSYGGAGNDTILVAGAGFSSEFQGNRGDDTIHLTGGFSTSAVMGGEQNDTIYIEGDIASSSVYGGQGNDTVLFSSATSGIDNTLFQDSSGGNLLTTTSQSFTSSSVVGGSGNDTVSITSTETVTKSSVQLSDGNDRGTITADSSFSAYAAGSGNDSLTLKGAVQDSTIYGGAGNDTLTITLGNSELDNTLIQDGSGTNKYFITGTTTSETLTLEGGSGVDNVDIDTAITYALLKGAAGADVIDVAGAVTSSTIYLGENNDRAVVTGNITDSLIQSGSGKNSYGITGNGSGLTLNGGSGTDSLLLTGASSSDVFSMGDGKDTLNITGNVDATVKMAAGNDAIDIGGTATGTFYLGSGDDTITVNDAATTEALIQTDSGNNDFNLAGADSITVTSGSGNDSLYAVGDLDNSEFSFGDGADTMNVGIAGAAKKLDNSVVKLSSGDDVFEVTSTSEAATVYGGAGQDTLTFGGKATKAVIEDSQGKADISLDGGIDEGSVTTGSEVDKVDIGGANSEKSSFTLGSGNDTLTITGAFSFMGSTLSAGDGNDSIDLTNAATTVDDDATDNSASLIYLGAGNDTLNVGSTINNASISSASGDNYIKSGGNLGAATVNDVTITLGSGADTLELGGSAVNAVIKMGGGNDSITVASAVIETATIYGGEGTDTLFSSVTGIVDADFADKSGIENAYLSSAAADAVITVGTNAIDAGLTQVAAGGDDHIVAAAADGDLTLIGEGTGEQSITGGLGADSIQGNDQNNTFTTTAGNDTLTGGAGTNTFNITNSSATASTVTVTDLQGAAVFKQDANITTAVTVKNVATDLNDASFLKGNAKFTFASDVSGKTIVIDADAAGAFGAQIVGNANDNIIQGGTNADTIQGGTGNETITLTAGGDSLIAGSGNDLFDNGANAVTVVTGQATIAGGGGQDTIDFGAAAELNDAGFALINSVEVIKETSGNHLDLTLGANAQTSGLLSVIGAGGADTVDASDTDFTTAINFNAGTANDLLVVQTATIATSATFDAGAGNDTLRFSTNAQTAADATFANYKTVETLELADGANIITLGTNAEAAGLGTVLGGIGNDSVNASAITALLDVSLTGGAGDDTLIGGAGADAITGGTGADNLTGGTGNDTLNYLVAETGANAAAADTITDFEVGTNVIDFTDLTNGNLRGTGVGYEVVAAGANAVNANTGLVEQNGDLTDLLVATALTAANTMTGWATGDIVYFLGTNGTNTTLYLLSETSGNTTLDTGVIVATLTGVDETTFTGANFADFT